MGKFVKGDKVRIIDTKNSNAVDPMSKMVGKTFIIKEIYNGSYVINGFMWSERDLSNPSFISTGQLADKSAKLFDINNLVDKND